MALYKSWFNLIWFWFDRREKSSILLYEGCTVVACFWQPESSTIMYIMCRFTSFTVHITASVWKCTCSWQHQGAVVCIRWISSTCLQVDEGSTTDEHCTCSCHQYRLTEDSWHCIVRCWHIPVHSVECSGSSPQSACWCANSLWVFLTCLF